MAASSKGQARSEVEIFRELEILCKSPGFVHALAYLCFRDNTIRYAPDKMESEDVLQQYSMERLIRAEVQVLVGLVRKGDLDVGIPSSDIVQEYIVRAELLLKEIHESLNKPLIASLIPSAVGEEDDSEFTVGETFREAIFYSAESAYQFQYEAFAADKYQLDNDWFLGNRGYSVEQATSVISTIGNVQNQRINDLFPMMAKKHPDEWTFLPAYKFSTDDIATVSGLEHSIVRLVVESFVVPESVEVGGFTELDDFNPINAYPVIKLATDEYLLFQHYSLLEAFYETPFFWMYDDGAYRARAMEHRGAFAERFSEQMLARVFGERRTFRNVDIYDSKNNRVGEIDVLVVFADRALIVQAKSKRLTIAARKGNASFLREDFKLAVQNAYDQAETCARYLVDDEYRLSSASERNLTIRRDYKEVYPICVVSDHYPALSFQARQFLKYQETETILPPFVIDVFTLDVLTEMLQSPLYFLSYINRRVRYSHAILAGHELTVLAYHLRRNLWLDDEYTMMQLGDDISADLDLAMLTRRCGVPGTKTPDGILTKYQNTAFGNIVGDIEGLEHPGAVNLGFHLLEMSGDTIERLNEGITAVAGLHAKDGRHHDFSIGVGSEGERGLTVHCNSDDLMTATRRLESYCQLRKYKQKSKEWYGLILEPRVAGIRYALGLKYEWEHSSEMDAATSEMKEPQVLMDDKPINIRTHVRGGRKIGRNEMCPCGSGKKYKRCCLR